MTIPASVKKIGKEAFRGCQQLREVRFAESSNLKFIGELCFAHSGIREIEVPPSLRVMAHNAFEECRNMDSGRHGSVYICADGSAILA